MCSLSHICYSEVVNPSPNHCQGKPRTPTIIEKICPNCGAEIEMFSIDTQMACEKCGFVAYNDTLSCVQWCQYAKKCVGEEMYNAMMEIAQNQKKRKDVTP